MAEVDILDSEILAIEGVLKKLADKQGSRVNMESFRKEIIERFGEIGFVVNVKTWTTNVDGVYQPEIEITGRCNPHAFDHDRMVHEVTNDLLDLGEGGVISTKGLFKPK